MGKQNVYYCSFEYYSIDLPLRDVWKVLTQYQKSIHTNKIAFYKN